MDTTFLLDSRMATPELIAARLDGHVIAVGRSFVPCDLPTSRELRASALARIVPGDAVVEGRAAAWVHGAVPAPAQTIAGRPVSIRPAAEPSTVLVRQVTYPARDVTHVGPLSLTTPLRTALDLARREPCFDLRTATAVATLLQQAEIEPARARAALADREGMPYRLRILHRLAMLERLVSRL